jgi:hypothetical protein
MTTTTHERVPDLSVLVWTGGIAAVWIITAFLRSDTTLHLGPLFLPLVPAILGRDTEHPIRLTLLGIGAGIAAIIMLFVTGNLDGPALEFFPDALTESIVLLAAGGATGLVVAASARQRTR